MRMQLLPNNPELGKSPYFWLVYLVFFIAPYFVDPVGQYWLGVGGVALALFLLLYFRNYWLSGAALWRNALFITTLGLILLPVNHGASVFLIYSACAGAAFERARDGITLMVINLMCWTIAAWLLQLGWAQTLLILAICITSGGSAIYGSQISRARSRLLRKQDEIEHLSKIAERERIGRDMHDVLGHSLSIVVLKSELARRLIDTDPTRAAREMEEVESTARHALQQVREAIGGYRSAGWVAELTHAQKTLETAGVRFHLKENEIALAEGKALSAATENILSLALREAVTNIVRHASATRCLIGLRTDDEKLVCQIEDDGTGLQSGHHGHGLRGMRERIEAHRGTLQLIPALPGLRLVLTLPLH